MENVVGYGMLGGVLMGTTIIIGRRPIINLIDICSSRLIPEEYSGELKYLEAYGKTIQDFVLTERERDLLANLAIAYEISEERLAVIEEKYRDSRLLIHPQPSKLLNLSKIDFTDIDYSSILRIRFVLCNNYQTKIPIRYL